MDEEGAYRKASQNMSEWMWKRAMELCTVPSESPLRYVDLGSGTGSAARHICAQNLLVSSTCLNLCRNQNRENRRKVIEEGLNDRVEVVDGTFDSLPDRWTGLYDGCFSQDAFVHAYSKEQALAEALRVTKGGGWLVLSDLHCGQRAFVSGEELHSFAQTNMVNDWQTPEQMIETALRAGWTGAKFVDLTSHIKLSFQLTLKKIARVIASEQHKGANPELLETAETYRHNLERRVRQVEQGIFRWGALTARKPYEICFLRDPPVVPKPHPMIKFSAEREVRPTTDVLAITILDKIDLSLLPPSVRALVSLSAGLDHVDIKTAKKYGIKVLCAGSDTIVQSVADYLLATTIFLLRNGFENIGKLFPESGWDLSWNADGIDLNEATVRFDLGHLLGCCLSDLALPAVASACACRTPCLMFDPPLPVHEPNTDSCITYTRCFSPSRRNGLLHLRLCSVQFSSSSRANACLPCLVTNVNITNINMCHTAFLTDLKSLLSLPGRSALSVWARLPSPSWSVSRRCRRARFSTQSTPLTVVPQQTSLGLESSTPLWTTFLRRRTSLCRYVCLSRAHRACSAGLSSAR